MLEIRTRQVQRSFLKEVNSVLLLYSTVKKTSYSIGSVLECRLMIYRFFRMGVSYCHFPSCRTVPSGFTSLPFPWACPFDQSPSYTLPSAHMHFLFQCQGKTSYAEKQNNELKSNSYGDNVLTHIHGRRLASKHQYKHCHLQTFFENAKVSNDTALTS